MGSPRPASDCSDALTKYQDLGFDLGPGFKYFSISMCFSSSTMYFQVHGTGILAAVVVAAEE